MNREKLKACIDTCYTCANANDNCAAECQKDEHVIQMSKCIELNNYSAEVCRLVASLMEKGAVYTTDLYNFCAKVCHSCANECEKHGNAICQRSAALCRKCAALCLEMPVIDNAVRA